MTAATKGFDLVCDVAIIGCGYAGAVAALRAHDEGARVCVFEKTGRPGGISVCSAGGIRVARDAAAALEYLKATNAETTPEPVLHALATGMTKLPDSLPTWIEGHGATIEYRHSPANYPFKGVDTFGFLYVEALEGFDLNDFPAVRGSPQGAMLFAVLMRMMKAREIDIRCDHAASTLIRDDAGSIAGVVIDGPDGSMRVQATGGVILTCGGFEGSADMQKQYWPLSPVLSAAYRANTGDGIRLAQSAGADLWHMWHFHGSYGFKHPDPSYPFGIRTKRVPDWLPGEGARPDVRMPWILVDKRGRRFMNEYEPYLQDTGARPLARYLPEDQGFAALPAWLIADERGRQLYPFGRPTWHEPGVAYEWSDDNTKELRNGLLRLADSLDELAEQIGVSSVRLAATIDAWNRACADGEDDEWMRPHTSMMPIKQPPFVFAEIWPIVSNTQGGPVHDPHQAVLTPSGDAVPGLYAAGENGSAFGFLYMSGGNIAECFIGGEIAARSAVARARRLTQ